VEIDASETTTLSVGATGAAPLSFQWYVGASGTTTSPIAGATSDSYTIAALTATTTYWVQVANGAGSANSTAATVTVSSVAAASRPSMSVNVALIGRTSTTRTVSVSGWAIDQGAPSGTGVDVVSLYAIGSNGGLEFLGLAQYGLSRGDSVPAQFRDSGFAAIVTITLPDSAVSVHVEARSTVTGANQPMTVAVP
jgi:hypothetical protein